jgi:trimeric autotransporter adhesin
MSCPRIVLQLLFVLLLVGSSISADTLGSWQSLGPTNITDGIASIAYKPDNPNVILAVSQDGRLWRTTDAGAHWSTPDTAPVSVYTAIRFDPNNPNVVYVGATNLLYKSTDAGATWTYQLLYMQQFSYFRDFAISKANSNHIYVPTSGALMVSLDGGTTWSATSVVQSGYYQGCTSIALRTDGATDSGFVSCAGGIYRNTNIAGSGTWELVLTEAGMDATALAIAPSNQDVVYVLSSEGDNTKSYYGGLHALFRSTTGGASGTWTAMVRGSDSNKLNANLLSDVFSATAVECGTGTEDVFQGTGYYMTVAVDPLDANRVWVGSAQLFRSDDGGANFGLAGFRDSGASTYLPGYNHELAFHPQYDGSANTTLAVTTVGGNYRTEGARQATATGPMATCNPNNSAIGWSPFNTGLNNAYLSAGVYLSTGTDYLASSSLGLARTSDSAGGTWTVLGTSVIPRVIATTGEDPNLLLALSFRDSHYAVFKSTDGGQSFQDITGPITGIDYYPTAGAAIDPTNKQIMYVGGTALWRSLDGGNSWSKASADTGWPITALAVSGVNPNYLLIGNYVGGITRLDSPQTTNASTNLDFTSVRSGGVTVNQITFASQADDSTAYAAFGDVGGSNGVSKTSDGGLTWTALGGYGYSFPGEVNSIVFDPLLPDYLYIGTRWGVYFSADGGSTWTADSGFPNVSVLSLWLRNISGTRNLVAFTGGLGAYKVALDNPAPAITSLQPTSVVAGGGAFQLTINGTGFLPTSTVTWNGSPRTVTQSSQTTLVVSIPAADVASAGSATIMVQNAAPAGGSASTTFSIVAGTNPAPTITSIAPTNAVVNTPGLLLMVNGTNFVGNSIVKWNGSDRSTLFLSATELTAALNPADLAMVGNGTITVSNPAPSGGVSNGATFTVQPYPLPAIQSVSPSSLQAGTSATVTVTGTNFLAVTTVLWNGIPHTATLVDSTTLKFNLTSGDTLAPGEYEFSVTNPTPGGGTSKAKLVVFNKTDVKANDILYDPGTRKIYAAISGSAGSNGNSIARIDPYSGRIEASFFVGSEPQFLTETSDHSYLYISLQNEDSYVRFNLATQTVGNKVWVGNPIGSIAAVPGHPNQVVLALNPPNTVVLYNNDVALPSVYSTFFANTQLAFGSDPTSVFLLTEYSGGARLTVGDNGLTANGTITTLNQYIYRLRGFGSKVYTEQGDVIDTSSLQSTRPFGVLSSWNVVPEAQKISYLGRDSSTKLSVYDTATSQLSGSLILSGTQPGGQFIRWGTDGYAFTDENHYLCLFRSSLAGSPSSTVDLKASATALQTNANIGDPVSFQFSAKNLSGNAADGVLVALNLSFNLIAGTISPSAGSCIAPQVSASGTTVLCSIGSLPSGQSVTIDVSGTAASSGTATALASVNSEQSDTNGSDNSAQAQVTVALGTSFNPTPTIDGYYPQALAVGTSATDVTITGQNFLPASTVLWNGTFLTSTYNNSTQLTVAIPAANLTSMGSATLQVMNPTPGGGLSNSVPFTIYKTLGLYMSDIAYDPYRNVLYGLVSNSEPSASKNSFVVIDPLTGNISSTIPVLSDPMNLQVSEDGKYAYLSGNNKTQIEQIDLNTLTISNTITLPTGAFCGGYYVGYLMPLPGQSTSLLVNRTNGCSQGDFVVYDNSTARPTAASGGGYPYGIAFDSTGTDFLSSGAKFHVGPSGVIQIGTSSDYFNSGLHYAEGFIYSDDGRKIDPVNLRQIGLFAAKGANSPGAYFNSGTPDPTLAKAFYFASLGNSTLHSFDLATLTEIDSIPTAQISGRLVRWGDDGLASPGTIMRSPLVQSGGPVNPMPALSSLSPSSATQNGSGFTLTVSGAKFVPGAVVRWNDVDLPTTYQSATQLTAAIPGTKLTVDGRAKITVFNPAPGGTSSNIAWFLVKASAPTALSLSPSSAPNGAPGFDLLVTAANVTPDSIVLWGGVPRLTTYTNDGKLKISVTTADLDAPKSVNITIQDPAWDNTSSSPATFQVMAAPKIDVAPTSLFFGLQKIGTVSTSQNLTVHNTGTLPLHITQASSTGEFNVSNNCPASVAVDATCTLAVSFAPVSQTHNPGTLQVTSDAANPLTSVSLTGNAGYSKAYFSQSSLSFPATVMLSTSATLYASLSNQGNLPLNISKISTTGDFQIVSNPCTSQLPMYYGCAIVLSFTPRGVGMRTGSLVVQSDDAIHPTLSLPLSGTGNAFLIALSRPTRPTRGQPATADIQLTPGSSQAVAFDVTSTGPIPDAVTISCSGLPDGVTCTPTPASVQFNDAETQSVALIFTAAPVERARLAPHWLLWAITLFLPLGACATLKRKTSRQSLMLLLCVALSVTLSCGTPAQLAQSQPETPSSPSTPNSPTTPTATYYTVTVTAQAGSLQKSMQLSLELLPPSQ